MTNVESCSSTSHSTRVRVVKDRLDIAGPIRASLTRARHCLMGQPALGLPNEPLPLGHPPGQNLGLLEGLEMGPRPDLHVTRGSHK